MPSHSDSSSHVQHKKHYRRVAALSLLVGIGLLLIGALLTGWSLSLIPNIPANTAGGDELRKLLEDEPWKVVPLVVGAIAASMSLIFSLSYYTANRIAITQVPSHREAVFIGALWGFIAVPVALIAENFAGKLPGGFGSGFFTGIWGGLFEETAKILLPVVLLILVAKWRDPKLGFWMVFGSAATFGFVEGVFYIVVESFKGLLVQSHADVAIQHFGSGMLYSLTRGFAEVSHPLYTAAAAAIIWLAAKYLPTGKAIAIGILGYLGAVVLHVFSDSVVAYLLANKNLMLSGFASLLTTILIFWFWYRPQLNRLNKEKATIE